MNRLMAQAVTNAFKQLLSEKHLYQFVQVDIGFIPKVAAGVLKEMPRFIEGPNRAVISTKFEHAEKICENRTLAVWCPCGVRSEIISFQTGMEPLGFDLPTINTLCTFCKACPPFNAILKSSYLVTGYGQDELFLIGYECQQCKQEPVYFLVRREGLKLRLSGRYPFEVMMTPKILPKTVSKYFGDAVIAHHAGQTLAGLFLLRVFIEQFWRTIPEVLEVISVKPRATGDEQADAYQKTLPTDFQSRFPSLKEIYGKLSEAIHSANPDSALFDESHAKIIKHFDARRVFEISN